MESGVLMAQYDRSDWDIENRLDVAKYTFCVYGWLYTWDYLLEPTPPLIKFYGLDRYVWSIQLCDGGDFNQLDLKVRDAMNELQPFYQFDRDPRSEVFGKHGEVKFDHTWHPNFYGTESGLTKESLAGRVVRVQFSLENDKGGTIRACPRLIQVMPNDFIYEPLSPDRDTGASCDEDW